MEIIGYISVINLLCWGLCFAFVISMRMPMYHPIFLYLIYHFLGYVIRPINIYLIGKSLLWNRIGLTPSDGTLWLTCLNINCALVAGVILPALVEPRNLRELKIPPTRLIIPNKVRFFAVLIILVALGLYSTYVAYGTAGVDSVQAFEVQVDANGGQRLVGVSGYALAFAEFIPAALLILILAYGVSPPMVAGIGSFVLLRIMIGAQRLSFVIVVLSALTIGLMRRGRRSFQLKTIVIGVVAILIFDVVGSDRLAARKFLTGDTSISEIVDHYQKSRAVGAGTSDFQEFDVSSAIYELVPERTGFNWGTQYLRLLVWPIPRAIWSDKPTTTQRINLSKYGNFFALTWSLHADLYSIFGFPSLVGGMFLVGLLLYRFHHLVTHTDSPKLFASYWIFNGYISTLFRDGGVPMAYFFGFSFIAIYLLVKAGKIRMVRIRAPAAHAGKVRSIGVGSTA
ncbi:O-antigen polymerase [Burkholderia cenocepacia]